LTALPPGNYQVTATAQGFAENRYGIITLNVGQKLNIDLMLRVNISETVEITSSAPVVETTRSQVSTASFSRMTSASPTT
jgi:hypothetical protein